MMFKTLVVVATLIGVAPAFAQQAKILKVQGRKAIIQFTDDAKPRVGQMIDLGSGSSSSSGSSTGSGGTRHQIIGGEGELSSLTKSTSNVSTSAMSLTARYGWNMGEMEYGPLVGITYSSSTGESNRTIGAGGFFDYNLVPNNPGTDFVYGAGALLTYSMTSQTIGNTETSGSVMRLEFGGQMKWFPWNNGFAVRGDLVYRYDSVSAGTSYTTTGIVAKAGLNYYF